MSGIVVQTRPNIGFAFEQLTVADSVQVLTPSKYEATELSSKSLSAFISIDGGDIRFTYDGTTPSERIGHLLINHTDFRLTSIGQIEQFKCYAVGEQVILSVTYERE